MRGTLRIVASLVVLLTAAVARAAAPETVAFDTPDGFRITGDLWKAKDPSAPVAILLHQFNLDRHSFASLVPALQQHGFTVLAIDQRGQADSMHQKTASGDRTVKIQELPRSQVGPMIRAGTADVNAALTFLAGRGFAADRVVLVGASYGCTVALLTAATEKRVRGVALLSPGAEYFGVDVLAAAGGYHGALFAIAAEDDPVKVSPGGARAIADVHDGAESLEIFPTGGHGTTLLASHPELADAVASYLATAATAP